MALPTGIVDRRHQPKVKEAKDGAIATITVTVDQHQKPHNPRQPYRVRCRDETGFLFLVFFRAQGDYLEKLLPVGATRIVSGLVSTTTTRSRSPIPITSSHPKKRRR